MNNCPFCYAKYNPAIQDDMCRSCHLITNSLKAVLVTMKGMEGLSGQSKDYWIVVIGKQLAPK